MKTNIRFLVMIAVSLLTVLGMSAQEPFFLHKEGVKLTYADKDKKGKINSYTETTATKVTGDADNCTVTYSMMVMDNKKNPVLKQPMTQTFEVKNGTVTYDPKSLVGQIMEGMQVTVTGTPFQLPSNVKVGDTFGDYTITLNLAGIKTNTEVTGVKAVAEETLDVNGTSIDCVVIENTTVSKVIGIKQTAIQKIWYGHGIGPVKTNMYNKKGKRGVYRGHYRGAGEQRGPVRRPVVPGGEPVEAGRPEHHAQHLFSAGDDAHRADRLRVPPPVHGKRHQVRTPVHSAQKNHGFLNKSNRNALLFWVTRFHLFKNCLHLRWFVG